MGTKKTQKTKTKATRKAPAGRPVRKSETATPPVEQSKVDPVEAPVAPAEQQSRDPRLPPVGTTIVKRDRHGVARCECVVDPAGIRYRGVLYRSLSAAASAAAADLALKPIQNGFAFWAISKPRSVSRNPLEYARVLAERYRTRLQRLFEQVRSDDERARLRHEVEAHSHALTASLHANG